MTKSRIAGPLVLGLLVVLHLLLLLRLRLVLWLGDGRTALHPHLMAAHGAAIDHLCGHADPAVVSG